MAGLLAAALVFALVSSSLVRSESERTAREEFDLQAVRVAALISSETEDRIQQGECRSGYARSELEAFVGAGARLYVTGLPFCPGDARPYGDLTYLEGVQVDTAAIAEDGYQRLDRALPDRDGRDVVATAAPLVIEEQVAGHLILVKPRAEVRSDLSDVAPALLIASVIGFIPALLLTLLVTTRLTRPIREMRRATDRVAAGDLSAEVAPAGVADLDALAEDFNIMVARLRQREDASRDFLMKVTHDLRTPLTAIRGHAAALSDGIVPAELQGRSLAAVEGEAARLEHMVTDLLDLARIDARRFRIDHGEVDGQEVLERAADAQSADAVHRGVALTHRIAPLPPLVTDARRLRQIVDNLLDNALRWTPDGGRVSLVAEPRGDGGVRVVVTDTGPGVPAHLREAVFEPFRSGETPDGRTGTGLGLAICRQLARALGGDVVVADGPGGGAQFVLTLPAVAPGAPAGRPAPAAAPPR
ncbi:MAG TPA: HAMP domain-containing sensor histidine kinase [Miltoncostaeaceae bacterium]|nr:HAMP domain-containing sensor histidine kinase [Miltoncostaeaceae bacterium]